MLVACSLSKLNGISFNWETTWPQMNQELALDWKPHTNTSTTWHCFEHVCLLFTAAVFYERMTVCDDGRSITDSDNQHKSHDSRNLSETLLFQQCKSVSLWLSARYECRAVTWVCVTSEVFVSERRSTSGIFNGMKSKLIHLTNTLQSHLP